MPIAFTTANTTHSASSQVALTVVTTTVGDVILLQAFKNVNTSAISAITVNTTAVTRTHATTGSSGMFEAGWFIPSATGTQTVSASYAGGIAAAQLMRLSAVVYSGVDSTTPIGSTGFSSAAAGSSGSAAVAVASTAGHVTVGAISVLSTFAGGSAALTSGAGVTLRENAYTSNGASGLTNAWGEVASSATASTVAFAVSSAAVGGWAIAGWTLQPSGAVAAGRGHAVVSWF